MRKVFKLLLDLNEGEGREFEKELNRLKIGKIDLFRLAWYAYKEKIATQKSKPEGEGDGR